MHVAALFAYVFAALFGLTLAAMHFRGRTPPKALSLTHGFFVACGFVFLLVALALGDPGEDGGQGWGLAAAFATAASLGVYMSLRHFREKSVSKAMIVVHGGINLVTVVLLGLWVFGQPLPFGPSGAEGGVGNEADPASPGTVGPVSGATGTQGSGAPASP